MQDRPSLKLINCPVSLLRSQTRSQGPNHKNFFPHFLSSKLERLSKTDTSHLVQYFDLRTETVALKSTFLRLSKMGSYIILGQCLTNTLAQLKNNFRQKALITLVSEHILYKVSTYFNNPFCLFLLHPFFILFHQQKFVFLLLLLIVTSFQATFLFNFKSCTYFSFQL